MSKVARIGDEETVAIYKIKDNEKVIEKPDSPEVLAQLMAKLKEYKGRINEKEKGWSWTIDAAYKALVLEALRDLPEGGKLDYKKVKSKAWDELVIGEMNVAGITHMEFFPKAWLVIWGYVYKPDQVIGGTGLPSAK